jgi:hypothetical protein
MQLHHVAYATSCRHTPMTHAYTGASCSITARPGHGLNSLTLTIATRATGPRPNVIRPVNTRATGLFLTLFRISVFNQCSYGQLVRRLCHHYIRPGSSLRLLTELFSYLQFAVKPRGPTCASACMVDSVRARRAHSDVVMISCQLSEKGRCRTSCELEQ